MVPTKFEREPYKAISESKGTPLAVLKFQLCLPGLANQAQLASQDILKIGLLFNYVCGNCRHMKSMSLV